MRAPCYAQIRKGVPMPRHRQDPWLPGSFNTIDLTPAGLPEVPLLGIYHHLRTKPALNEHAHPGLMEITCLARGEQDFAVDGRTYHVRSGEVFITFPDEYHSTGRQPYGRNLNYWLQLRLPSSGRSFLGLNREQSGALCRALRHLPHRHFRGAEVLCVAIENIYRIYHAPDEPLQRLRIAQELVGLLLACIDGAAARPAVQDAEAADCSRDIRQVMQHIRANPQEVFTLPELAARAGLSPSRFKAKFKEQTGIPPGDFVLRVKIERARQMLQAKMPVTAVSYALGFSSSQYFATVFRRFTGRTPGSVLRAATEAQPQNAIP